MPRAPSADPSAKPPWSRSLAFHLSVPARADYYAAVVESARATIKAAPPIIFGAALVFSLSLSISAHDIPNDVTVHAFIKPETQHLRLLVRVPLQAMRDVDFPTRGPGFLDLARAEMALRHAAELWISQNVEVYEGDARLRTPELVSALVSLESDRSFTSYEEALSHVTGSRLPNDTDIYWNQALLDVLFEYAIQSDRSDFSFHPKLGSLGLRVTTVLRFLPPGGVIRAFEFHDDPGLVRLDPRWHQAALRFVEAGFLHILEGIDHLLFLVCLVIPFRRLGSLIPVVTSFTVAHSITLIASAYNLGPDALWFPPLVEMLIAISIFYMAIENIVGSNIRRRWVITFGFGLIHGFGFSFALQQTLQFAGSHMLTSLLAFNVGVEIGQLLVLVLLVPVLEAIFRFVVAERIGTIILSALIGHTGWHWMIERGTQLSRFPWPTITPALLASGMRWLILVLIFAGLVWLALELIRRKTSADHADDADEPRREEAEDETVARTRW